MKKCIQVICLLLLTGLLQAQEITMYPTHWFAGMQHNKVQLIIKSKDEQFAQSTIKIQYPGISLLKSHRLTNGKYLIIDILITPQAKPGMVKILATKAGVTNTYNWELKKRREGRGTNFAQGVTAKDFIYLIMPDRFSNGDPSNDRFCEPSGCK